MTSKKEPTQREKEEAKERARSLGLKNIKESNLLDLAIAYFANREGSGFGENDNVAVEEFLYSPAMRFGSQAYDLESGEKSDLIKDSLLASRQDGKRYTGPIVLLLGPYTHSSGEDMVIELSQRKDCIGGY